MLSPSLPLRKCGLKFLCIYNMVCFCPSLPLRKCGLKYLCCWYKRLLLCHFPCGSVDWNNYKEVEPYIARLSLPLRKCGLKSNPQENMFCTALSLPLRKCGLKFILTQDKAIMYVCHFPCGSVDWNTWNILTPQQTAVSLPLRKCGLKFVYGLQQCFTITPSLPLRKCGLKYLLMVKYMCLLMVTSLAEVWIEIMYSRLFFPRFFVTSLAEVWIEIPLTYFRKLPQSRHFPCGSVDWNTESQPG